MNERKNGQFRTQTKAVVMMTYYYVTCAAADLFAPPRSPNTRHSRRAVYNGMKK